MEKITVLGAGRSGIAVAKLLNLKGSRVFLTDKDSINEDVKKTLRTLGVQFEENGHSERAFDCDYAVISPGINTESNIVKNFLTRKIDVISEIEIASKFLRSNLMSITGTNGKSTTTALFCHVLNHSGIKCHMGGNLAPGIPLSEISIQALPNEWVSAEISSFQMERVKDFSTDAAVWTNISSDHLDRHREMKTYASLKADLIRRVKKNGFAVLNSDFPEIVYMSEGAQCRKYFFGSGKDIKNWACINESKAVFMPEGDLEFSVGEDELFLKGKHNLENVLAAGISAYLIGIKPQDIVEAVKEFKGLRHRLEKIGYFEGILFINNSMCTNEAAFRRSLEAFRGSVTIVGGKAKNTDLSEIALSCRDYAKSVILIGASSADLSKKLLEMNVDHQIAQGMKEAVEKAAKKARAGETVILNPGMASFDMFKDFQERGDVFSREVRDYYEKR
ncbi:UDP-N-acetylmuramoyl-L-alanine--D-glutamate ligase [candidate division WOR-3 bacterium]|nr:UDP-N-acetylmuramoyl-L-alanine--D-glutamate ligase [candidate division WOR-3 bacterium]